MSKYENLDARIIKKLIKSRTFRQGVLLSYVGDHGMTPEDALKKTIRNIGINEFSKLSGISPQNINEYLSGRRALKKETLNKYLKPFGLQAKLAVKSLRPSR